MCKYVKNTMVAEDDTTLYECQPEKNFLQCPVNQKLGTKRVCFMHVTTTSEIHALLKKNSRAKKVYNSI